MSTLAECLQEKEYEPERMLIVSIEETRNQGESFWLSVPVKSTLPNNVILHRIILDENADEYEQFTMKYDVQKAFSLFVFGSNSTIISKSWTEGFPEPAEFATYISGTQVGAFEFDDQHDTQYDQEIEEINAIANGVDPNIRVKTAKISIRTENGMQSQRFNETDTIHDILIWLNSLVGEGHQYIVVHNGQKLPEDHSMTLKAAGLCPSALLKIEDDDELRNNAPRRGIGQINQNENGCWSRFVRKVSFVFSFINPFACDIESESFWEYQPSNNPDIAQVIARNVMGV